MKKWGAPKVITPKAVVMVGTPTYTGDLVADFVRSLLHAQMLATSKRIALSLNIADKYSLVQYARNRIAQDFLDNKEFTHLFWIDADIGFDAYAFVRLVEAGKDVIAGAYPTKSFPMQFPIEPVGERTPDGLQRCSVVPTGFLCVSRKAMEAVAETVPSYIHFHDGNQLETKHIFDLILEKKRDDESKNLLIGEDVVLCRRLVELGFDIWVDPDISFVHVGPNRWGANLKEREDAAKNENPATAALRQQIGALLDQGVGKDTATQQIMGKANVAVG